MQVKYFDFDEVTSTNDIVIEKLQSCSDPENILFVVTAKHQTKGRGRNNKD